MAAELHQKRDFTPVAGPLAVSVDAALTICARSAREFAPATHGINRCILTVEPNRQLQVARIFSVKSSDQHFLTPINLPYGQTPP